MDKYLLKQELNSEVQEAIAYYLDILRSFENSEFEIIGASLIKLKGYWSNEEINAFASIYLDLIESYSTDLGNSYNLHYQKQLNLKKKEIQQGTEYFKALREETAINWWL